MDEIEFNDIEMGDDPISPRTDNPDVINENEQQRIKNKGLNQDITHRNILVYWVMVVVSVWLLAVFYIIAFCWGIADSVKVTLLTTTTINILGLPLIILKGLFK